MPNDLQVEGKPVVSLGLRSTLGSFNALRLPESDHWRLVIGLFRAGEVAEWSNVPDSKSGVPQGTGGSNPSLSASFCLYLLVSGVPGVIGVDLG